MKKLKSVFIALFAAIICAGSFIKIPLGLVPIVMQNVLCILSGVLFGGIISAAPTALFLLAGLIGLPVYSGGSSGVAVWIGPTGGFLAGYLLGALVAGLIAGKPSVEESKITWKNAVRITIAIFAGMIILYVPGVIHFARWAKKMEKVPADKTALAFTLSACVIPYIPGDLLKIVIAVPVALKIRPVLAQYLGSSKSAKTKKEESLESTDSE